MCIKFIRKIFGIQDPNQAAAQQQAALDAAAAAAETPADSEEARRASERRLRKLLSRRGVGSTFSLSPLDAAPVAVKSLLGA